MQPPNEEFFTLFSKASSKVVESAAILMEFAAVPHERWAKLAKTHDSPVLEVIDAAVRDVDDAVATRSLEERRRERASVPGAARDGERPSVLRQLVRHGLPQLAVGDVQRILDVTRAPFVLLAD